jgi:hypothetical protein
MLTALATILRIASRIACVIVIVSFGLFVIDQTSSASAHQQEALQGTNGGPGPASTPHAAPEREGEAHRRIDEVSAQLTSPFAAVTAGSSSQWVVRGVSTMLALLVYGIGVGFLARVLRLRL